MLTTIPLRSIGIAYTASALLLFSLNVRWRYLKTLLWNEPKELPVVKVDAACTTTHHKHVVLVFLHGMWHDATYFSSLQMLMSKRGYKSISVSLLPGQRLLPGGSQKELVGDLEVTLARHSDQQQRNYVLIGHSQGGLVAQSCLRNSSKIRDSVVGAVLLGTYPLGMTPPLALLRQPRNMYNHVGYAWICLFGRLFNAEYTKHIFLRPTTNVDTPRMQQYMTKLLAAPSDGLITMSHFPTKFDTKVETPVLVLGAEDDVIYPPRLIANGFDDRFSNTTHVVAQEQAHCFVDPGWEISMASPLLKWLDKLCE